MNISEILENGPSEPLIEKECFHTMLKLDPLPLRNCFTLIICII